MLIQARLLKNFLLLHKGKRGKEKNKYGMISTNFESNNGTKPYCT